MSETDVTVTERKLSDWQRFKQVGRYHAPRFLGAITLWGAADAWAQQSGLMLASTISVLNAILAASMLSAIFHEFGHFAGARISRSYSPMVRKPTNAFIFGFNFEKNSRNQFLSMSIGGPAGNWLFVLLILLLVPFDGGAPTIWGRAMLLAVAVARAISVTMFEGPIILRTLRGGDPQTELDAGLRDGSGDRGQVIGYGAGALVWLIAI